jgi:hypothetical protein
MPTPARKTVSKIKKKKKTCINAFLFNPTPANATLCSS